MAFIKIVAPEEADQESQRLFKQRQDAKIAGNSAETEFSQD